MAKNVLQKSLRGLDNFQQRHRFSAFPLAVIKKFADDRGGQLAALITYYGFLSLFPLILVVTTILKIVVKNDDNLRARVTDAIGHYFPVISNELQTNIQSLHRTGIALALGIILILYGARGVADAMRHAFNEIWNVPKEERPGFPKSIINSFLLIFVGGGGLVLASALSSYALGLTHDFYLKIIPIAFSLMLLIGAFYLVFSVGISSKKPSHKDLIISAVVAAIGVQILQSIGGYLLTHELKKLGNLYGTFALVIGLLLWLYLQVQVILYAVEIASVRALKLWPRRIIE